jgi:putative transposase
MPRAKLFLLPNYLWHITHRCHNRAFLLRFARDRVAWMQWVYQARIRYGLRVLAFAVTSNHIHLLVYADGREGVIPRSILLAASRVALEYNRRKRRSGAFWEGNYHATAVQSGEHFRQCLVYIDLNAVRAGIVRHPADWPFCGFQEIAGLRARKCLIDKRLLMELLGMESERRMADRYQGWIQEALASGDMSRQPAWTESVAVGREDFVKRIHGELGLRAVHKETVNVAGGFVLREPPGLYLPYRHVFGMEKVD